MSPKRQTAAAAEDNCNTETEEGTAALLKKRSRRVSFAEITSVHVFDRDDDGDTTPSDPNDNDDELEQFNRDLGFLVGDDNQEQGEEDNNGDEGLFLRPTGSPASTAGSTTSNDEDNFFGPVSASFIKPGRLSDSGASDMHDITMDSTAFSQHFRSLAKSDSGGDLKTPTGVHLSFEESTPSQNNIPSSNLGSSMLLNSAKKPISAFPTSVETSSDGSGSQDMSLVERNPNRYDYGRLSFGWDVLSAEGVKDVHTDEDVVASSKSIISPSPIHLTSTSANELNQSSGILIKGMLSDQESGASEMRPSPDSHVIDFGMRADQESEMPQLNVLLQQQNESPHARSLSSLSKRRPSVFQEERVSNTFPSTPQNHVLSITDGIDRRAETVPSVQKSISKLRKLDASPFAFDMNVKMNSLLLSSESLYRTPPCSIPLSRKKDDDDEIKHVDASASWKDQSQIVAKGSTDINTKSNTKLNSIAISENLIDGSFSTGPLRTAKFGTSPAPRSAEVIASEQSSDLARVRSLVSQLTWSGGMTKMDLLTLDDPIEDHPSVDKNETDPSYPKALSRKRIKKDVLSGEGECVDEIDRFQRSPKVHKSVAREFDVLLGNHDEITTESSAEEHESRLQHWTDVLSESLAQEMLPPSIDKLNLQAIGVLEDRMVKLQRLQTYEMRHNIIQSQKSAQDLALLQHRRTGEAKILLQRVLHEHAKLQLMRVKREKLQRNVQLLRHGIQEAQLLKLNSLPHIRSGCNKEADVKFSHCQSISVRGREKEVPGDKVTELRQLHDSLETKLTSLTKSIHSYCKLKGTLSHIDTVSAVNGYLKKKECCKYIRSDLQLWKVLKIFTRNGYRNLVLNYLDFVIQRITFKAGSASNIVVSSELNYGTLLKSFPSMDASTALSFAVNATATKDHVGSPSLTQETQITSSVLGNLVDVIEEVQHARFDILNLTYARFVSPFVGQLDLHFHFVGMKSGRKVAVSLDMSCLKWGIYPSDIIPYKLESSSELSGESIPEQLLSEIRAAVQSIGVGYSRIIRICRTVSRLVQAWSE